MSAAFKAAVEPTHTAGPWLAKQVATYSQPGWVILWPDTSKPGVHHRRLDSNGGFTEDDARLIAAAPEMLEALCALVLNIDAGGATLGAIRDARLAIAKATVSDV